MTTFIMLSDETFHKVVKWHSATIGKWQLSYSCQLTSLTMLSNDNSATTCQMTTFTMLSNDNFHNVVKGQLSLWSNDKCHKAVKWQLCNNLSYDNCYEVVKWQLCDSTHREIKLFNDSNRPNVAKAAPSYDKWYFIFHLIKPIHPFNRNILFHA